MQRAFSVPDHYERLKLVRQFLGLERAEMDETSTARKRYNAASECRKISLPRSSARYSPTFRRCEHCPGGRPCMIFITTMLYSSIGRDGPAKSARRHGAVWRHRQPVMKPTPLTS